MLSKQKQFQQKTSISADVAYSKKFKSSANTVYEALHSSWK